MVFLSGQYDGLEMQGCRSVTRMPDNMDVWVTDYLQQSVRVFIRGATFPMYPKY